MKKLSQFGLVAAFALALTACASDGFGSEASQKCSTRKVANPTVSTKTDCSYDVKLSD